MSAPGDASSTPASGAGAREPVALQRLSSDGAPLGVEEVVESFAWGARDAATPRERPHVALNMVSSVDGRATVDGRSGPLSDAADRALFHALRAAVDGVLVGAGTVRAERYGPMIRDASVRERRRARGLREQPLACVVSGRLSLSADIPLLADPDAHVVVLTPSPASLTGVAAHVEYVRAEHDGVLDLPRALAELRERHGVRTLLCEGGPHLNAELLRASLVDELLLSLAPVIAGGEEVSGESLRIVAGSELDAPLALELLGVLEHASHLFLRYGVRRAELSEPG